MTNEVTGEIWIGGTLHKLTHWDGDITKPDDRSDLLKDVRRAIRSASYHVLLNYHKGPKADSIADNVARCAADAVIDQLWKGYCL